MPMKNRKLGVGIYLRSKRINLRGLWRQGRRSEKVSSTSVTNFSSIINASEKLDPLRSTSFSRNFRTDEIQET